MKVIKFTKKQIKNGLQEQILKGDIGDGIPNFLSPDDILTREKGRQTPIRKDKLEKWLEFENPESFCTTHMLRGYKRNEALIDLEKIPPNIQLDILASYSGQKLNERRKMFDYFVEKKLKNLMEGITDF